MPQGARGHPRAAIERDLRRQYSQISRATIPEHGEKSCFEWSTESAKMGIIATVNDKFAASVVRPHAYVMWRR